MEFKELIEQRRSVRKYAPGEISKADVEAIVGEALNAPSWKNTEVTRYYAAISAEAKGRLWKEALPSFNVTSTANAAALVAVTFKQGESGYMGTAAANELGEMWGAYDCGLASAYFVLAAKNHGWDSLILGIRDAAKIKVLMGIPDDEVVTSVIALGKAAGAAPKPPRKPVGAILKIGTVLLAVLLAEGAVGETVSSGAGLVRALAKGAKKIVLRPGTYELTDTLHIGPKASGLQLIGGKGVRLTRSIRIRNGQKVKCSEQDAEPSPNSFREMRSWAPMCFYDHQWATPARWPNEGWAVVEKAVEKGRRLRWNDPMAPNGSFTVAPEVAARMAKWDFASGDIRLAGYWTHDWAYESVGAASFDPDKRLITVSSPTIYGIEGEASWSVSGGHRFIAYNVRAEMDAPGEWFYDRATGKVEFCAPKGGVKELRLVPDLKPALCVEGATNVVLRDLDIEYVAGDAVVISNAQDVCIERCRIRNVGGRAIVISGGARCVVAGGEIAAIGTTAIEARGGDRAKLVRAEHVIRDCEIHDFGRIRRTYSAAAEIDGCGISIVGNRIYDAPHTAIFYWGNEMLIESNEIFDVLKETGDAGAVYSGRDPTSRGNVLRFNYVHDCGVMDDRSRKDPVTMAFYLDDCDCGDSYVSNRVANVPRGMLLGGGQDIRVVGNVFSNCCLGISVDARAMTWAGKHWDSSEDKSWQITRKVKEMKVDQEPWRSRYPALVNYLQNNPREPKDITIRGNSFVNCLRDIDTDAVPSRIRKQLDIQPVAPETERKSPDVNASFAR